MKKLILDTSTSYIYVGIGDDNLIDEVIVNSNKRHASIVIKTIEELLNKNNLKIKDFDEFIVGIGPGSYTGLRVALTVIKSFTYLLNAKIKTISSLYLISSGYEGYKLVYNKLSNSSLFTCLYNNESLIFEEKIRDLEEFKNSIDFKYIICNEDNIKVDYNKVISNSRYVDNYYNLVPNYLKD